MPYQYWTTATTCFIDSFNFIHVDGKGDTVSYVERHSHKFTRKTLPSGCNPRYLLSAEREVEKRYRYKTDPSLRDEIFSGYRWHTGGT